MHQNAPHQKKRETYLCAHCRANQYFSSPALIVHAGHGRANEAKQQRQCAHQSVLSAKRTKLSFRIAWISHPQPRDEVAAEVNQPRPSVARWPTSRRVCPVMLFPSDQVCRKLLAPHIAARCQHSVNCILHVGDVTCR